MVRDGELGVVAHHALEIAPQVGVQKQLAEVDASVVLELLGAHVGADHGTTHSRIQVRLVHRRHVIGDERIHDHVAHGEVLGELGVWGVREQVRGERAVVGIEVGPSKAPVVQLVPAARHIQRVGQPVAPVRDVLRVERHGPDHRFPTVFLGHLRPQLHLERAMGLAAPHQRHGAHHPGVVPGVTHRRGRVERPLRLHRWRIGSGLGGRTAEQRERQPHRANHARLPRTVSLSHTKPSSSVNPSRRSPTAKLSWLNGYIPIAARHAARNSAGVR